MTADRTPYSIAGRFELPLRVRNGHPSSLLAFIHNLSTSSVFVPIAPLPPPRARWGLQQKRCRRVQRPFLSNCIILGVNSAIYDCNSLRTCAVCEGNASSVVLRHSKQHSSTPRCAAIQRAVGYFSGVVGLFFLALGLRHLAGWSGLFPLLAACAVVAALSFTRFSLARRGAARAGNGPHHRHDRDGDPPASNGRDGRLAGWLEE